MKATAILAAVVLAASGCSAQRVAVLGTGGSGAAGQPAPAAQVVPLEQATTACGWSSGSAQAGLLRAADAAVGQDERTSAAELLALPTGAPEQARAAAASCVAGLTGEPDELAPTGGPANLVRVSRWGERLAFDRSRGSALWAAHLLTAGDLEARAQSGLTRGDRRFSADPALPASPRPEDYRGTGWDRGHLQPAGDAADERALDESFLLGNVVPQHREMNSRAWEYLESSLRELVAATHGRALVVTGALFLGEDGQPATGEERLPGGRAGIPTHLFKAFLLRAPGQPQVVAAYLCPNRFEGRDRAEQVEYLKACSVPIATLAKASGLTLFRGADGPPPAVPRGHRGQARLLWPERAGQ